MRCQVCGGQMEQRKIETYGRWGVDGEPVIVRDVPAWVCGQCGEVELESDVAQRVAEMRRAAPSNSDTFAEIPVRSFEPAVRR